jgi:hypothetical protein
MKAVRDESIQRLVDEISTPGPSVAHPGGGEGGHMPIDSGFMRASVAAARGAVQLTTVEKPKGDATYSYSAGEVSLVLAETPLGETITIGWRANYAEYANYRYQFVGLGLQRWPQIVAETAASATLQAHDRTRAP